MIAIAYATTSTNLLGADAGIIILDGDVELARETVELALDADEDGDLDKDAADTLLTALGFERTEPWTESGGQWAAEVG